MPLIEVTAQQGTLNQKSQHSLMARLSEAVLRAEGAPVEDPGARALMWAHYIERPEGDVYVGGAPLEKAPLRIAVTTPAGALNDATRKSLVAEVGAIVDETVGAYAGRLNHWVMLYEVPDGGWGGAGSVFSLADIQAAMNIRAA